MSSAITRGLMLFGGMFILGCGRTGEGSDSSATSGVAGGHGSTGAAAPVTAAPGAESMAVGTSADSTARLIPSPPGIDDAAIWNEPQRLADFLATVPLVSGVRKTKDQRHCVPNGTGAPTCVLELRAARGSAGFDPDRMPAGGVVLGRIAIDQGSNADDWWSGIKKGRTYFWVIRPPDTAGKKPRSVLVDAATGIALRSPHAGKTMRLLYCHDDKHGGDTHGFYCCEGTCPKEPGGGSQWHGVRPPGQAPGVDAHTTPPWISCKNGCCYADWE